MRSNRTSLLLGILTVVLAASLAGADTIYLQANFDDKPLDMAIGTGGSAVGEPVEVASSITAIVRAAPLATPSLELQDNHDFTTGTATFEFLGSAEITTGLVVISANLWFHELSPGYRFMLYVREQGGAASSFATIYFNSDGSVRSFDANGSNGIIGSYQISRPFPVRLVYDMDAGTYDVYLDDQLVLADRAHGVVGSGVGSVLFGCLDDPDYDGRYSVDDILVTDYLPSASAGATWGWMKALFR